MDKSIFKIKFLHLNVLGLWGIGMITATTRELFPLDTVILLAVEPFLILMLSNLLIIRHIKKNDLW